MSASVDPVILAERFAESLVGFLGELAKALGHDPTDPQVRKLTRDTCDQWVMRPWTKAKTPD